MSRTTRDGLVATWVVLWLVVGTWTGVEVWRLSGLTTTVAESGRTLDDAGAALQALGGVPVVGDESARLGAQVRADAARIVSQAQTSRGTVRRLAVLLGLSIALVPTVPVVVSAASRRRTADR